ncbi:MAG: enoyl-CoA hydratase/isomerase family protein [Rubrivivax sp.]
MPHDEQTFFDGQRLSAAGHGAVAVVRLFNPPHGCMDAHTEAELLTLLDRLDAMPQLRVAVLTGRDAGVFVRHYDVAVLEQRARVMAARGLHFSLDRPVPEAALHRVLARIEASERIFIAAINGTCMGGGYELALACDLRYAQAGGYRIGLPEVNIGLLPGAGGTQKLQRVMGPARALEALLLGRTFLPAQASDQGLVNACVDDVLGHAMSVAQELAGKPQPALGHIKRLAQRAGSGDPAAGLADERTLFCDTMVSDDALQRMAEMNAGRRDISDR